MGLCVKRLSPKGFGCQVGSDVVELSIHTLIKEAVGGDSVINGSTKVLAVFLALLAEGFGSIGAHPSLNPLYFLLLKSSHLSIDSI